jgi:hypothetical protein
VENVPEQIPFGPVSWVFPGITLPNAPLGVQTTAGTYRTQQIQFEELSKLAVPHKWSVVKLTNVILK